MAFREGILAISVSEEGTSVEDERVEDKLVGLRVLAQILGSHRGSQVQHLLPRAR